MSTNTAENSSSEESSPIFEDPVPCRPFVKWAGGKSQLLPELKKRIPNIFKRFFEPFVGGGAFLFGVQPRDAHIIDRNPELMNTYTVVRDSVEDLISDLRRHIYERDYYYQMRDADRELSYEFWTPIQRASRFIYLNKTCYNGLYRVNSKGHFNTPYGRYNNPTIVDADNLRACSQVLRPVKISQADFTGIEDMIAPGDFVYFDPPYMPLSATANFTGYDNSGFTTDNQKELFDLCCRLDQRGVQFMLSNSSSPFITMLYQRFKVELVMANRAINSKAHKRGAVQEVIVTNY